MYKTNLLTFLHKIKERQKDGRRMALYQCECGSTKIIAIGRVKYNYIRSCGCLKKTEAAKANKNRVHPIIHGDARRAGLAAEYTIWYDMKRRCYNKNRPAFPYYGGRGIYICKEWKDSYQQFLNDMGRRPTKKHSIDRINNDGPYSLENCRWATSQEQSDNNRIKKNVATYNGETAKDASLRLNGDKGLVARRVKLGWSIDSAFSVKPDKTNLKDGKQRTKNSSVEYILKKKKEDKEKRRQYYIDNREKVLKETKDYNSKNKEKISERKKKKYHENREKTLEAGRERYILRKHEDKDV